jgi:PAS domain S-box-containing protein
MSGDDPNTAEALVHQAPDAIVFADTSGVIRFWNAAATRVFGFSEEQAIGESLDLIIPERFREAHWNGFDRALEARVTKYAGQALATRSVRSDGVQIYVELSFSIVLDDDGTCWAHCHTRGISQNDSEETEQRVNVFKTSKQR